MRRSNPPLITTSAFGPRAHLVLNGTPLLWHSAALPWMLLLLLSLGGPVDGKPQLGLKKATDGIDPNLVLKQKQGQAVHVFENAVISCKGRVFRDCTIPASGCDPETPWSSPEKAYVGYCDRVKKTGGKCVDWAGCGFDGGSCDPHIAWSHVTKNAPYVCEDGDVAPGCAKALRKPGGPLETVVALTQPQWGAYYHFLVDGLTRITWVMASYPEVVKDPATFFHTGMIGEVARGWFGLLGIDVGNDDRNRLLEGWWRAKTVYFPPSNPCANGRRGAHPAAITAMQKTLHRSNNMGKVVDAQTMKRPVALLVRRTGNSRKVTNFDQVRQTLESGLPPEWTVKVFSDNPSPSPQETCALFNEAAMILGPHGAGFSNLLCARPGAVLVEFQQASHSWDFQLLSIKLGLGYIGVQTEMDHYGPGLVEIRLLEEAFHLALASLKSAMPSLPTTPATAPAIPASAVPAPSNGQMPARVPFPSAESPATNAAFLAQDSPSGDPLLVAHPGPTPLERVGSWGAGFLVASMLLFLSRRMLLGRGDASETSSRRGQPQAKVGANIVGAPSRQSPGEGARLMDTD